MTFKTYTEEQIKKAVHSQLPICWLDTGLDGEDDILIGNVNDCLDFVKLKYKLRELPEHWELTKANEMLEEYFGMIRVGKMWLVNTEDTIGKTIKIVKNSFYSDTLIIIFTDNTFTIVSSFTDCCTHDSWLGGDSSDLCEKFAQKFLKENGFVE